jgi:hypothetical protein
MKNICPVCKKNVTLEQTLFYCSKCKEIIHKVCMSNYEHCSKKDNKVVRKKKTTTIRIIP